MFRWLRKMSDRSASLLLLLLLTADFVFIGFHIVIEIYDPNSSLCNISGICAYMNIYHLIKLFWITILFGYILNVTRCSSYISWIMMFASFLFDDALLLHQLVGDYVANIYHLHDPSIQSRYFELAVLAIAGLFLLAIVGWGYVHSTSVFRKISIDMLMFIGALVFFGLIVDLGTAIHLQPAVIVGLGFIEDGGELVTYSFIVWYVFLLSLRNCKPELFLHDFLIKTPTG